MGTVRGNFFAYRAGASAVHGEKERLKSANNVFDLEKYKTVQRYVARYTMLAHHNHHHDKDELIVNIDSVYILRGLQLSTKKGIASACDPLVTITIAGQKQKSKVTKFI